MGTRVRALVSCFTVAALLVATTPTWANEQHVVDSATLQQAIAAQSAADAASRQLIDRALARPDVEAAAARMGLDLQDARTAIAGLSGQDLALVAQQAGLVNADPVGGQRTIVISVTTLLLIIIIILLIAD
jgi:sugar diacid utilization regulator